MPRPRILIIGDSYMSVELFRSAFAERGLSFDARTVSIAEPTWPTHGVTEFEGDPAEVASLADGYEILAIHGCPVTADVVAALPDLRMIACARGGPVNVDQDAARERGVVVATTPGKNAAAVAELTIGFVISLVRNVPSAVVDVSERARHGHPPAETAFEGRRWFGREVSSLRLGIIGFGNVARIVAQHAVALGAQVSVFDPFVTDVEQSQVHAASSLDEVLITCDVVSVHARATPENRHMIGAREIARMRPGSYLINTARESLVDEHAILSALESGQLAGAALDVNELDGPWKALVARPNLILTPHLGGATFETLERGARMLAAAVDQFLAEHPRAEQS